ncbi:2-C-methyl-D-erythritol 4-phosphate cytidylyltransferase [Fusobacterium simiae]|uniref:2-C-methyl-D-erythritol 4-phosphate cytidylyltransferase n=1 Tax=Fusobacterium simiae TaxID=855 RepID=A0ABT4DIR1_FUSSI|nr:2-C-methyl-D-erythritol 4-phosphate cytidylyltransferase [Fusobacterium simiae]MCY7008492.1 2-C-methyl-D-erythritol 4-phosphate cytidylyltransferase [Fusobacterium simiae]
MYSGNSKVKKKVTFILAAAGQGKRMNLDSPKQFLDYKGEPLFYSSLKIAFENKNIDDIIIVTNKENLNFMVKYCQNKNLMSKVKYIVEGGSERQYSIYNAIKKIESTDIVIIQDAARPFLKGKYIKESIKVLNDDCDGAIIGVKCKDTVKIIDENGIVLETPNRDSLILTHTPQTFKFEILKKAHQMAEEKNILATDDASLVEMISGKIKFINGDYDNIKITVQEDLKFLK